MRNRPAPVVLPLVLLVLSLTGCGATPEERLHSAKGMYLVALQTGNRMADAGEIPPSAVPAIRRAIQGVDAALRLAETYVGNGDVFEAAMKELEAALLELAKAQTDAKRAKATAPSLPADPLAP